jgi:hypothetical protein
MEQALTNDRCMTFEEHAPPYVVPISEYHASLLVEFRDPFPANSL